MTPKVRDLLDELGRVLSQQAPDRVDMVEPKMTTITQAVRDTIALRKLTSYAIGKATGLRPHMVKRFIDGLDIRAETLDRICDALGLAIVERGDGLGIPQTPGPKPIDQKR